MKGGEGGEGGDVLHHQPVVAQVEVGEGGQVSHRLADGGGQATCQVQPAV